MNAGSALALAALLAFGLDQTGVMPLRPGSPVQPNSNPSSEPLSNPSASSSDSTQPTSVPAQNAAQTATHSPQPLSPESKLLLIRYVDGEFAKLVQSLPSGKKGFRITVGKPISRQKLSDALRLYGTAATQGDTVQITGLEFRPQQLVLLIDGGGKKHFNWRQHLQVGVGNVDPVPPATAQAPEPIGGVIILDYGRPIPDMSPDDLKHDLAAMLDFSKQHSAAVNWIDTLPPQYQEAIKDHHAAVGMDSEMVLAAMGRPEHKVREKSAEGNETEDWIYGSPPAQTTFVTFAGDTVIRVEVFN